MNPYEPSRYIAARKANFWWVIAIVVLFVTHAAVGWTGYLVGYHDGYAWGNDDRVGGYEIPQEPSGKTIIPR